MDTRSPVPPNALSHHERARRPAIRDEDEDEDAALSRRVVTLAMIGIGISVVGAFALLSTLIGRWLP